MLPDPPEINKLHKQKKTHDMAPASENKRQLFLRAAVLTQLLLSTKRHEQHIFQ